MKGDSLPSVDHVVRYIRPGLVDGEDIDGEAFRGSPEKDGEIACSINWLDYFRNQSKEQQLREVRRLIRLEIRPTGRFAELNVGLTRQCLADWIETLKFVEDPLAANMVNGHDEDPSHALIKGLPNPDQTPELSEMIGDMIATCVAKPLHKAIEK